LTRHQTFTAEFNHSLTEQNAIIIINKTEYNSTIVIKEQNKIRSQFSKNGDMYKQYDCIKARNPIATVPQK